MTKQTNSLRARGARSSLVAHTRHQAERVYVPELYYDALTLSIIASFIVMTIIARMERADNGLPNARVHRS
jgi:hypothetical protein